MVVDAYRQQGAVEQFSSRRAAENERVDHIDQYFLDFLVSTSIIFRVFYNAALLKI